MLNEKETTMSKIDINYNFWDDVKYNKETELYSGDPDCESKKLYEYHQLLWNKGCLKGLRQDGCELKLSVENNRTNNNNIKELRLGADNFVALYMKTKINEKTGELEPAKYKTMREKNNKEIFKKQLEIRPAGSKERIKYTIGGSIIFPRLGGGLNQSRGYYNKNDGTAKVGDRIDITLACIKEWFENPNNKNNPLWNTLAKDENKIFFSLFRDKEGKEDGFKNYIDFFLFQDFVNQKTYEVKNLFASPEEFKNGSKVIDDGILVRKNNLPESATEYENLYNNLINAIKDRTERIKEHAKIPKDEHFDIKCFIE
jgi:hypothetical protein